MRLYVGCELRAVPNWRDILPSVQAPSNYKDPAKIAAYIAKQEAKREDGEVAKNPLTGFIDRAVIVMQGKAGDKAAPDSDETLTEDGQPAIVVEAVGDMAGAAILDAIPTFSKMDVDPSARTRTAIFGCDILRNARLMALQYAVSGNPLPFSLHWAVDFDSEFRYNHMPGFIDPVRVLFGSSPFGGSIDLGTVGRRLGIPVDPSDAASLALFAFSLAKMLGL